MVVFDPPKFSVRLKDVLGDFVLADRRVADGCDPMDIADAAIDWNAVRACKEGFAKEARVFLDGAFETCIEVGQNGR